MKHTIQLHVFVLFTLQWKLHEMNQLLVQMGKLIFLLPSGAGSTYVTEVKVSVTYDNTSCSATM